jgi:hypothetical protein
MSHKCLFALGMCAATLLTATSADASLKLRLTDSATATSVTIEDEVLGFGGDGALGVPGSIVFSGPLGSFTVVVEVGTSKPIIGSTAFPSLTLSSSVTSFGAPVASTLTIELTDTDFGSSNDPLGFLTSFNSTFSAPATLTSYIDTSNAEFGTGTLLSSFAPNPLGGPFDVSDSTSASTTPSPYSMTIVATVTHGTGNSSSSFDAAVVTPEPTALLVWGGLVALVALPLRKSLFGAR